MKKEIGVTLVSLVVTIIILIILAGISINTLVGDNGVITKAQQAKENTLLAQEEEAKQLNQLYSQLNYVEGNVGEVDVIEIEKLKEQIKQLENKLLDLQNNFNELKTQYNNLQIEYGEFKNAIANAITERGIETQKTDITETMVENIKNLPNKYLEEGEFTLTLGPGQVKENVTISFKNRYTTLPIIEVTSSPISGSFTPYIHIPIVSEEGWRTHVLNASGATGGGTTKFKWIAYER
jgi:predicted nuclease with TOPRIM domain